MLDRIVSEALFLAATDQDIGAAERHLEKADPLLRPLLRRRLRARLMQTRDETAIPPTVEGEAHLLRLAALRASGDLPRGGTNAQAGYREASGEAIAPDDEEAVGQRFREVVERRPAPWSRFWLPTALLVASLGGATYGAYDHFVRVPAAYRYDQTPLGHAFSTSLTEFLIEASRAPAQRRASRIDSARSDLRKQEPALGAEATRAIDSLLSMSLAVGQKKIDDERTRADGLARQFNEAARARAIPLRLGAGVDQSGQQDDARVLWLNAYHVVRERGAMSPAGPVTVTWAARLDDLNVRSVQHVVWESESFGGSLLLLEDVETWLQQRVLPALGGKPMSLGLDMEVAAGSELASALERGGQAMRDDLLPYASVTPDDATTLATIVHKREVAMRVLTAKAHVTIRSPRLLLGTASRETLEPMSQLEARDVRRLDDQLRDPDLIAPFERLRDTCAALLAESEARRLVAQKTPEPIDIPEPFKPLLDGLTPDEATRLLRQLVSRLYMVAHSPRLSRVALLLDLTVHVDRVRPLDLLTTYLLTQAIAAEAGLPPVDPWLVRTPPSAYPRLVSERRFYTQLRKLLELDPLMLTNAAANASQKLFQRAPVMP